MRHGDSQRLSIGSQALITPAWGWRRKLRLVPPPEIANLLASGLRSLKAAVA